MTIAVGALIDGAYVLAADSQSIHGDTRVGNARKVYSIPGLAMAGAGAYGMIATAWDVLQDAADAADGGVLSLSEFCLALRRTLLEHGAQVDEHGYFSLSMLITDGRSLHLVNSGLFVEPVGEFAAIGSGRAEAYAGRVGARRAGATWPAQVQIAVETAAELETSCGGPVTWEAVEPGALTLVR